MTYTPHAKNEDRDYLRRIIAEFTRLKQEKQGYKYAPGSKVRTYFEQAAKVALENAICPEVYVRALFHYADPSCKQAPFVNQLASTDSCIYKVSKYTEALRIALEDEPEDGESMSTNIGTIYTSKAIVLDHIKTMKFICARHNLDTHEKKEQFLLKHPGMITTPGWLKIITLPTEKVIAKFKDSAMTELMNSVELCLVLQDMELIHHIDDKQKLSHVYSRSSIQSRKDQA